MKKILSVLLLFAAATVYADPVAMQESDGATFAKYLYNGHPVWSDAQRDEIIANGSVSSKTITNADFTSVAPSADEVALSTSVFVTTLAGNRLFGTVDAELLNRLLTSKPALKLLAARYAQAYSDYANQEASSGGFLDFTQEKQTLKSLLVFVRRKYLALP